MKPPRKALSTRLGGLFGKSDSAPPATAPGAGSGSRAEGAAPGVDGPARGADAAAPGADAAAVVEAALRAQLASMARRPMSPEQVDAGVDMWSAGYVDSLSYVRFLAFIEERWGVAITDVELSGRLNSVRTVAVFVHAEKRRG